MMLRYIIENIVFLALFTVLVRLYALGGAINAVFFYPKEYQRTTVERGLTDEQHIKKHHRIFLFTFIPIMLIALTVIVGAINRADTFLSAYLQSLIFLEIMNVYDGIVIDKIWVGNAKLWKIEKMEDIPYVQTWRQVLIKRSILAAAWIPLAAIVAGLALLL
ncbi:MAG: hypothetical protein E7244_28495 [Enterocloster citroniae]|nr:hypothetical protein [Enterocloster citroniae]